MIMIHGGHGNVPGMFFSEKYNKRNDEYGGSFEKRCRFGEELLDAVRREVGDKLSIEYRISAEELTADGMGIEETLNYAKKFRIKLIFFIFPEDCWKKIHCFLIFFRQHTFPEA